MLRFNPVNEPIEFPSLRNTPVAWSESAEPGSPDSRQSAVGKKRGPELRCMVCGAWYYDHVDPVFHTWNFDDGVRLVRQTAQAAGDKGGGYRGKRAIPGKRKSSRGGPVLWALRVLKAQDFIQHHTAMHGDAPRPWGRRLLPESVVGPYPGEMPEQPEDWEPDWIVWMEYDGEILVRVIDQGEEFWAAENGDVFECDPEDCKPVDGRKAVREFAADAFAEEEIPF